jgi:lipopolysaccharide export LptBFGC system permease protein LptF
LQIGIGLVINFIYVLLVVTGQAIIGDKYPAWIAVWIPNILAMAVGALLMRIAPK